jgi:basic membrane protein A and related proteins
LVVALAGIYFLAFVNKTPTPEIIVEPSQISTRDLNNMLASSPELNENKICAVLENYEVSIFELATDALTWEAMQRAADDFGVEIEYLMSLQESDYEANMNTFINDNCELIVSSSWIMADSVSKASTANPDQKFAAFDVDSLSQPNVLTSTIHYDQSSFLSGYLAAGMSQTGKVAVYSVIVVPGTQILLDGFAMGVEYYNEVKGGNVELLGWDMETEQGFLVESFDNPELGRDAAKTLMNLGADVIMPVAGGTGLGSLEYIAEQGRGLFIGVDFDFSEEKSDLAEYFLASVVKNIDVFVYDSIKLLVNGNFGAENEYPLNLENGGVSLVYGSSWAEKPPWEDNTFAKLRNEIEELIPKIISGEIKTIPDR